MTYQHDWPANPFLDRFTTHPSWIVPLLLMTFFQWSLRWLFLALLHRSVVQIFAIHNWHFIGPHSSRIQGKVIQDIQGETDMIKNVAMTCLTDSWQQTNLLLWSLAFGIAFSVVYGLNIPLRFDPKDPVPLTRMENSFYGGLSRLAWAVALSWVVFACTKGYGGWVNELLSWEAFQPLSKLTFTIYLVHEDVIRIVNSNLLSVPVFSHWLVVSTFATTFDCFHTYIFLLLQVIHFFAILTFSTVVSAVIFVGFEIPYAFLINLAFQPLNKKFRGR